MGEYRPKVNFDQELIDYESSLMDKLTYETASVARRLLAWSVDFIIIIVIWVLCTNHLYDELNNFVANLGIDEADFADVEKLKLLRDLIWKLYYDLFIVFAVIQFIYNTLLPALLGGGKTIGKLLAGIRMVSIKTLDEAPPRYLILRELVGRTFIETFLVIPMIISVFTIMFRKDSRAIHDLVGKTIVIKSDLFNLE